MATIDDLLDRLAVGVAQQPITWRRANWQPLWDAQPDLPGRDVLDLIDAEFEGEGSGTIRRSWVRNLRDGDPVVLLTASTIWGYGNYVQRGRPALQAMLTTRDVEAIAGEIVDASKHDAGEGFAALFDSQGRTRVKSLNIAFGTKLVHFAGYDSADPKPLILDRRVFAAAQSLDDPPPVPDPTAYTTSGQYRDFCVWAREVARRRGVEPEDVEYALFVEGGNQ